MTTSDRIKTTIRQDVQSMHAYAIQPSAEIGRASCRERVYSSV